MITSRSFILTMRNVSDKSCRENQNTHVLFCKHIFRISCRLWDEVENIIQPDRPYITVWLIRTACCIPKPTNAHSECDTYCFPTATIVSRTAHLNVALEGHCLSCLLHGDADRSLCIFTGHRVSRISIWPSSLNLWPPIYCFSARNRPQLFDNEWSLYNHNNCSFFLAMK